MPRHTASSLRQLVLLFGTTLGALALFGAAIAGTAPHVPVRVLPSQTLVAPADTDSVAITLPPVGEQEAGRLAGDTSRLDTRLDTSRATSYFPRRRDGRAASVFARPARPFAPRFGRYWTHDLKLDSTGLYVAREQVGGADVRIPRRMTFDEYRRARLVEDLATNWNEIAAQQSRMQQNQRGGVGFNFVVPGGRQSAFSTIFGKPQVDLRVNGTAYIQAGFDYRKSDQQVAVTGRASRTDPTFKQDLQLGITGTIGDKLNVNVSWDTKNTFDYQNQLHLEYQGYEDEIVQRIEAGNVFLNTPSTLIRGGQSLFGIKSEFQLGGLHLTTVASQQEGQSNSLGISGGAETVPIDKRPTDYEALTHFFLGYYFRNRWEPANENPTAVVLDHGFEGIEQVELWKRTGRTGQANNENVRQAIALVDLGESPELLTEADDFTRQELLNPNNDQYSDTDLERLRVGDGVEDFLQGEKGLGASDWDSGQFTLLRRGSDYQIDPQLGYISLNSALQDGEVLAVSYRYLSSGGVVTIGDMASETGGAGGGLDDRRLVLKLLRGANLKQPSPEADPAAWYLELRNIYRIGNSINLAELDLRVVYEPPGQTSSDRLTGIPGRNTLLQLLGLDRVNTDGAPSPDNRIDARPAIIDAGSGRLIFPYLEPFGSRIASIIDESGAPNAAELKDRYVFSDLYAKKREEATRNTRHDVYRISGEFRGGVLDHYDLGAYAGLVEGSVRVTSGGTPLREGTDFLVDYTSGSVRIVNRSLLAAGRDIEISYEQNQFMNLQKKTLIGARAEYAFGTSERNARSGNYLGATMMRLNQKSPVDKFRIGEEPVSNLIWGFDGAFNAEPRWLTRAIDALPFVQTKTPSAISITGEFAQLRPSHVETMAFERTRKDLRNLSDPRDFGADELSGVSYLDDFEGFENTFSLRQPNAWTLAAAPDSIGGVDLRNGAPLTGQGSEQDSLRSTWRGTFGWYQVNQNLLASLQDDGVPLTEATALVFINDVYPNRDTRGDPNPTLPTMDVYFDPSERGPYNYTTELEQFLAPANRKHVWGGMTQRLPDGYNEFNNKNIEFVEFIIKPFSEAPGGDAGEDARLFLDLGDISEDVIPDGELNTEDAISITSAGNVNRWSRRPSSTYNAAVDISDETGMTEDLGLDGLASYDERPYQNEAIRAATEQTHFSAFVDAMRALQDHPDPNVRAEARKAVADPSGDDYHDFEDDAFFNAEDFYPGGASLQQRFSRYFAGTELNSYEGQNRLASASPLYSQSPDRRTGNSRYPDSEDLNLNSKVDTENAYFQYEVPLSRATLSELALPENANDYVVGEVGDGWYQIRIPIRDWTRRFGGIADFSLIESMRLWTTGHEAPATIRFASFELVGSQWQKSTAVLEELFEQQGPLADTTGRLTISSINYEENAEVYRIPLGAVQAQTRLNTGGVQNNNEQSLVLRAEDLGPGGQRAIFKTFQDHDLLKYQRLRMFVHADGTLADGRNLADLPLEEGRSKARLFVRLGANESNDYYEYEQPLTPSRTGVDDPDEVWQTNRAYGGEVRDLGSVLLDLAALNQLKVARDEYRDADGMSYATDSLFWSATSDGMALPGRPDVSGTSPPGTRIAIKGNPSLARVRMIVIGVRNPADPELEQAAEYHIEDLNVWINELRAAGYDEKPGMAGLLNADIRLADLGGIKANYSMQTEGFGSLASTLNDRDLRDLQNWAVTGDLNLDKFLPERYGWRLPVSAQVQSSTTTPAFAPSRGDIRVDDLIALIEEQDVDPAVKDSLKQDAIEAAQTYTANRSVNVRVTKQGSDSRILRNTIDGVSLSYAFADNDGRSPTQRMNDSWRWNGAASYTFQARPKTLRPLWFLDALPVLDLLGGLHFNYIPQRLTFAGTAARTFSQSQDRPRATTNRLTPGGIPLPDLVAFPLREQQSFQHRRNFGLQYNPFGFLNLSFDTNTGQSLNAAAVDTLSSLLLYDEAAGGYTTLHGLTIDQALSQGRIDSSMVDHTAFEVTNLDVQPTGDIVRRLLGGRAAPRTEQYAQGFTATYQPKLTSIDALDWITLGPFTYDADFNWQNGPVGRAVGANVGNQVDLRAGISVQPQSFWRKFGFYRDLEKTQAEYERERTAADQKRDAERAARKEYRASLKRWEQWNEREARRRTALADSLAGLPDSLALPPDSIGVLLAADSAAAAMTAPTQPTPPTVEADSTAGGFRLPLPNPGALFRRSVVAITGMRDFRVTYTGSRASRSSNVGTLTTDAFGRPSVRTDYTILDALQDRGPSLAYRFGLDRRLPPDRRILDSGLQVGDVLQDQNRVQATTALAPSKALQINLNWNADWGTSENVTYRLLLDSQGQPVLGADGRPMPAPPTIAQQGSNRASIWTFGADYRTFFEQQYAAFTSDQRSAQDPTEFGDADGNGRVALTNEAVVSDFLSTFVAGPGAIDQRGYLPFPMPSWNVTYSGLGKWPILRRLVQSASLRHGYSADYSTDFRTNLAATSGDSLASISLRNGPTLLYNMSPYEASTIRINQRYAPLVQVDLTFKNRLSTSLAWNKSNAYTLSPVNNEVGTLTTNEASFRASFQQQGLSLPFLPGKRLNNRVTLSLTIAIAENDDRRYFLRRAIEDAVAREGEFVVDDALRGDNVTPSTSTTRFSATPMIGYTFSNTVSADFTLKYERFDSATSNVPSFTSINGGFNVRVSISN